MPPKPKPTTTSKPKKKRYVSERKQLVKQLDDIVSLIVRKRDGGCVTPNGKCYGPLTCSHYYDRTNWGIRWDLRNCNTQCSAHNNAHNYHTYAYSKFMEEKYGSAIFRILLKEETQYRKDGKWKIDDLHNLLEGLTQQYNKMIESD